MSKYYLKPLFRTPHDLSVSAQDKYLQMYSNYKGKKHVGERVALENKLLGMGYMIKRY